MRIAFKIFFYLMLFFFIYNMMWFAIQGLFYCDGAKTAYYGISALINLYLLDKFGQVEIVEDDDE